MRKRLPFYAFASTALAISIGIFLVNLHDPAAFLGDYGRTLGRMVSGDWKLSEVTEPERHRQRRNDFQNRGPGRRRGWDFGDAFVKLDKDGDGSLTANELGDRLASSVLSNPEDTVTAEQFRQAAESSWQPSRNKAAVVQGKAKADQESENGAKLNADTLFDPSHVVQVEVRIDEADWQTLCNQSRDHRSAMENPLAKPYTNFRADIIVDGHEIRDIAIRKKGFIGSQDRVRPSLKIKFDEYVEQAPIAGLDRLTLNNNKQDHSLVSQSLTYDLFRKANVPAPRSSFAAVTVNGRYLGVYTHVESFRKPFLQRSFGNDSGNMYEGTLTDFYPLSIDRLEAKTNKKEDDRSRIIDLATLLDSKSTIVEEISTVVDIDNFLRYWAVESLINFWDGYTKNQNNYFVYENPGNNLMYFMPWGADSCFGRRPHFTHWGGGDVESLHATSILANRLLHMEGVVERYREVMLEVLGDVWNEEELNAEVNRIETLLADHIDFHQVSSLSARDQVRDFIANRRAIVMAELDGEWPGPIAAGPRIPRHNVEVGSATGSFTMNADGTSNVQGQLTMHEEELEFDSIEVGEESIELIAIRDAQPISIVLRFDPPSAQQPSSKATGEIHDSGRRTKDVKGQVRFDSPEASPSQTNTESQTGTFQFKIVETKGGR